MLITKEQQEAIINNYINDGNNNDKCIGFIDGVVAIMNLISNINNK